MKVNCFTISDVTNYCGQKTGLYSVDGIKISEHEGIKLVKIGNKFLLVDNDCVVEGEIRCSHVQKYDFSENVGWTKNMNIFCPSMRENRIYLLLEIQVEKNDGISQFDRDGNRLDLKPIVLIHEEQRLKALICLGPEDVLFIGDNSDPNDMNIFMGKIIYYKYKEEKLVIENYHEFFLRKF